MEFDDPNAWIMTVVIYLVILILLWKVNFVEGFKTSQRLIISVAMLPITYLIIAMMTGD